MPTKNFYEISYTVQVFKEEASVLKNGLKIQECRPMINTPPPFKGLNIRIPIIIHIKGRGFTNQGSGSKTSDHCHPAFHHFWAKHWGSLCMYSIYRIALGLGISVRPSAVSVWLRNARGTSNTPSKHPGSEP